MTITASWNGKIIGGSPDCEYSCNSCSPFSRGMACTQTCNLSDERPTDCINEDKRKKFEEANEIDFKQAI